ncbi:NAD(P)-binding domain protein [Cordyceps fumosorosea ARSEF 2679]|uniref:NAD(P)-binding domain protein n=1 Tax=Cordyceps fumosorosea (strain ARSEF 2679) TaxID=1081104 RepID=A0A167NZ18_CORFA|nr:NAD(P)-binding domain protein [Cordyceps fumosorosea ARSEF 2679]OAA56101.1 NAD(P)-binding domain protein [Cordyceps fumosorosea ARSEF 2679]
MTMAGVKRPFPSLTENEVVGGNHQQKQKQQQQQQQPSYSLARHHQHQSPATTPNRVASPDHAPSPFSKSPASVPEFRRDATLVLVGVRGSGKSTLAVIASTALRRTVLDLETAFQRAHQGLTTAAYRQRHGAEDCQARQARVLAEALAEHPTGRILVCSWMSRQVRALLREFAAAAHPVVHVVRDAAPIRAHLKLEEDGKVESLMAVAVVFFRTCANLEFFNVTEQRSPPQADEAAAADDVFVPSLALKHAEKHFTKFLSLLYPVGTIPFVDSAFPLASTPLEERQYTYVIPLPIAQIITGTLDIDDAVCGADAVQVTVDVGDGDDLSNANTTLAADITKAVGIVRRAAVLPIICHLRVKEAAEPAVWELYKQLIAHTFKLAPEMVTIDLRLESDEIRTLMKGRRRSKVIGCREMPVSSEAWDGYHWKALYGKAVDIGCDSARFTRPASSLRDNVDVAQFRTTLATLPGRGIPVSAYNSGSLGRTSACFNPLLTVVSSPASIPSSPSSSAALHPTTITPMQATNALFAAFVYEPMKLYVLGANVDYSMSPIMHSSALRGYGMPHTYRPHSSPSLRAIQHLIRDPCFGGASVGLPFKVEALSLTDALSRHARAIGAVNTLIPIRRLDADGSVLTDAATLLASGSVNRSGPVRAFYGENTDWVGIKACIQSGLSPANAVRATTCGVVIGAGGMARAAVYAMLQIGVRNVVIYNRTPANAAKIVAHFQALLDDDHEDRLLIDGSGPPVRFHILETRDDPWPEGFRAPTILVSCIPTHPIGDEPAAQFTAPEAWLASPTGGVVFELGYKTLDTPLLRQARAAASRGWVAMDGIDLLPEQGFAQFELFTGRRAPRGLMRRALFQHYRDESGSSVIPGLQRRMQMMAR